MSHQNRPRLMWGWSNTLSAARVELFVLTKQAPRLIPVLVVPLPLTAEGCHVEGHVGAFECDGIRIEMQVLATRAPQPSKQPKRQKPKR